jgi:acyl-CoA synthetase (AMP-forming)/AMP-acid ligase II
MRLEANPLGELSLVAAERATGSTVLIEGGAAVSYEQLPHDIDPSVFGLSALGLGRAERVAIYLDKRRKTVIASFGVVASGAVFVPIRPPGHSRRFLGVARLDCRADRVSQVQYGTELRHSRAGSLEGNCW